MERGALLDAGVLNAVILGAEPLDAGIGCATRLQRPVDQVLRNAMVADHREAVFLEASADFLRDFFERAGNRNAGNVRHVYSTQ